MRSWVAAVGLLACACEGSAPAATTQRPAAVAEEWLGRHASSSSAAAAQPIHVPPGTWVLHIGDSFVEASLWQNLAPRFKETHTKYSVNATTATYTTTWAFDPALDDWLRRGPAMVLVTLGANEYNLSVPLAHAKAVEVLSRRIAAASTSCVWISPPMWRPDTGILGVIHDHSAPCLYLDSDAVLGGGLSPAERQPDRIHPNHRGGARWAEAVWGWLLEHRDPAREGWALLPFESRAP